MTAPTTSELIEKLRSNEPLPLCPYDRRSPLYWTAPNDKPCEFCGSLNEVGAPNLCKGADTSLFTLAASRLADLEREREEANRNACDLADKCLAQSQRALAAERSLQEAKGVIEPFARACRFNVDDADHDQDSLAKFGRAALAIEIRHLRKALAFLAPPDQPPQPDKSREGT